MSSLETLFKVTSAGDRWKMTWFLLFIAVILALWAASLWRILSFATRCILLKPRFLSEECSDKKNVLLVVAHPDDESMFFAPSIIFLSSEGHNIHILCMSNGNAEGIGNTRKDEFYQACAVLKVPLGQVKVLDHPSIQDGFNKPWDHSLLAQLIDEEIKSWNIDSIITFDTYGVSGHPNHVDVHHGICTLLRDNIQRNYEAWELVSASIFRKYTGPVDVWLSILCSTFLRKERYCILNNNPYKSYLAMGEHKSQWVWFRKLFVLFSSYTYMNMVQKINLLHGTRVR